MTMYLLEVVACQLLFYLFYYILLRKDTLFERNRIYLLLSLGTSFVLPFLHLPESVELQGNIMKPISDATLLMYDLMWQTNATDTATSGGFINWWQLAYSLVMILMMLRLLASWKKIDKLISSNPKTELYGFEVVLTNGKYPAASFMDNILWDETTSLNKDDAVRILQHEQAHVAGKHTYDIMLIEVLKALMWFNPLVYLYAGALRDQHEYIADKAVLQATPQQAYRRLIVKTLFNELGLSVVHSFNQSQIQKRLNMMKKTNQSKYPKLKMLTVVPMLAVALFVIACVENQQEDAEPEIQKTMEITVGELKKSFTDVDKATVWLDNYLAEHPDMKSQVKVNVINPNLEDQLTKDTVFEIVEKPAGPKEGITEWMNDLAQDIHYTEEAKQKGIEGKVYIQFIVDKEGNGTDLKILKGIDSNLDLIALEALKKHIKDWRPAYQRGVPVKQRMVIPVAFKL
ncbi:M56 family metallopeptidase [Limibacter armeniacum]|uniref:M56 family metallopeptidase n=1 Tax=Limibacter armeniacum TaxID=466084 RepID=UPI002FE6A899